MAASVRIEDEAFNDGRIEVLGALIGADKFSALGRLAHVWRQCTAMGNDVLPRVLVAVYIDPDALVGAGLAEKRGSDLLRIKGARGRIEWLEDKRRAGRENGKKGAHFGKLGGRPRGVTCETPRKPGEGVMENPPTATATATEKNPERERGEADASLPLALVHEPAKPRPRKPQGETPESARVLAAAAVAELNRLTGRAFAEDAGPVLTDATRLAATGHTPDQAIAVVRAKHRQWAGDAKMADQLKPSVLLRPSNFAKYLAEDVAPSSIGPQQVVALTYTPFDDEAAS